MKSIISLYNILYVNIKSKKFQYLGWKKCVPLIIFTNMLVRRQVLDVQFSHFSHAHNLF